MVIEPGAIASALRSGGSSCQRLAPVALKVARIPQVHPPVRVDRQVDGELRRVVMSIEQLIDKVGEVGCGRPRGGLRVRHSRRAS